MKIFLSGLENGAGAEALKWLLAKNEDLKLKWGLMSYWYIQKNTEWAEKVRDASEEILIDSGAHSFQFGAKTSFEDYTNEYAKFIQEFDRPNVIGYFEMDIDNVIGYENVLKLRKILENVSDKIIPVWHPNRGIEDFKKMCQDYSGKIVAITGFAGKEIRDDQYIIFLKYAKKYNCRVHCLGMTRKKVLDKVPFDYVDSSSWAQYAIYGRTVDGKKLPKPKGKDERINQYAHNFRLGQKFQDMYYKKWRNVCKD